MQHLLVNHLVTPHLQTAHLLSHATLTTHQSIHHATHNNHELSQTCHPYWSSTHPVLAHLQVTRTFSHATLSSQSSVYYVPATKPSMAAISMKSLLSMKKRSTPTTTQPTSTSRPMMPKARAASSSSGSQTWNGVREENNK